MAISIILVFSNSSKESVRTSTGRVILFGIIPTTIPDTTLSMTPPDTHIDTTLIPITDPSEDPSSDHIPPLPATLPFLSSTDDSSGSDIPDTPPLPTHGTPFTRTTLSTQRSPAASGSFQRRVMVLVPGQPIPLGRSPFCLDDFLGDSSSSSSSSSSSEISSDPSSDDLSDSSSDHLLPAPSSGVRPSHHLCLLVSSISCSSAAIIDRASHNSSSASPSHKRSRSPATSIPLSSSILGALSYARVDLLPSPKRVRNSEFATNLEDRLAESSEPSTSKETDLEMDVDVVRSDGIFIDPEIQAEIDECIAYADALRDKWIDARVVVEVVDQEEIKTGTRGLVEVRVDRVAHPVIADDIPETAQEEGAVKVTYETLGDLVQRFHDHTVEIPVHRVHAIEGIQRDQGHRIVATWSQNKEDKVKRFVGGLPKNIQGNAIAAEPTKLQDAIRVANNLMDQKLKGYARSAKNKRRLENNLRDNRGQQLVFKRQNIRGQNVARAYTAENNEKRLGISRVLFVMSVEGRDILGRIGLSRGIRTVETRLETKMGTRLETRLEAMKLHQRRTPLEKEEQTLIPTLSRKYIQKGCQAYLAQVTSKKDVDKLEEKRLEDVPIVQELSEVFLEDFPGLPPAQQVEFQIDLVHGDTPVARSSSGKEHEGHLKLILRLLKKEELYAEYDLAYFKGVFGLSWFCANFTVGSKENPKTSLI
nr:putative reverse transcriptase domain-containing protein [Tanacetum cinerariifolium]